MPYIGKKPADIIATAVDTTTGTFSGAITSSAGATISTADNTAQLILQSTDTDASSGPQLTLKRDSSSPADDDFVGRVKFIGENDADQEVVYVDLISRIKDASDGTEDSEFRLATIRGGTETTDFKITSSGLNSVPEIVFNDDSTDLNFRVESNDSANMLFVNGGNNQVGIGVDAASTVFHVETSTDGTGVSGDDIYVAKFYNREATDSRSYGVDIHAGSNSTDQALRCKTHDGGTQLFLVKGDGSATIANGLTLTDGNLVVASGHGIDFSAASGSASGSASALLDDYEEGTWTAAWTAGGGSASGYASQVGVYTKVGNMVHLSCYLALSNAGNMSGSMQITGLPFSSENRTNMYQSASIWINTTSNGNDFDGDFHIQSYLSPNNNVINVQSLDGDGGTTPITATDITDTTDCMINISYRTG